MSGTRICLVLLIGLPGSGKTTLCGALVEFLKSLHATSHVIPITYDELIPADVLRHHDNISQWKEARRDVLNCVQNLILCLTGLKEFSMANSFEMSVREEMIKTVVNMKKTKVYIIVDDNMYYRSMRYEYYQLARLYKLSFCQLFVQCSVTDALNRNSSRDTSVAVPQKVITRMAERLQPPDKQNNPWERFSLTLPSEVWTVTKMTEISDFLNYVAEHPVMRPENDSDVCQESRIICSTNVMHQVDVTLRKIIGDRMRQGRETGLPRDELQVQSKALVNERQHILEGIRTGRVIVPPDICKDIELAQSNGGQRLRDFLHSLLTKS
jgi:O-phosphoseryl-tRNA(Sec) kinase